MIVVAQVQVVLDLSIDEMSENEIATQVSDATCPRECIDFDVYEINIPERGITFEPDEY